jgi:hypothetical protein
MGRRDRHGVNIRVIQTRLRVSPPSRLRNTPSISTPAQTVRWSSGSTITLVTTDVPMEHSRAMSTANFSQRCPPSRERQTAAGRVPANRDRVTRDREVKQGVENPRSFKILFFSGWVAYTDANENTRTTYFRRVYDSRLDSLHSERRSR